MPKKAVVIVLLLGLLGAALFVYFTFPRTKEEIPRSNNQRPFPSAPGPNGVPVPENVPRPSTPSTPHGPSLRVMAWASGNEVAALRAQADAFTAAHGEPVSLEIQSNEADYRRDLATALISQEPPDLCLVTARDFSGLDPLRDLTPVTTAASILPRTLAAFTIAKQLCAIPAEFSVDVLFYNPRHFDRAGLAYPDRHWTWDIMEGITRALASLRLKDSTGASIYPLELPANFDFWNILSSQAGHPVLDHDRWHLAENDSRESQVRGLDLIHEFFHDLAVTAPPGGPHQMPGRYFARQRASLLIAPSELAVALPAFPRGITLLPADLSRASLARVNGWAVTSRSTQRGQAAQLAQFLAAQPLHGGWVSARAVPANSSDLIFREALDQSVLPRLEPKTARLAQLLDQQINLFATSTDAGTPENFYAQIQAEYRAGYAPATPAASPFHPRTNTPQIRGL